MICTVCNSDIADICEECHKKAHEAERARLLAIVRAEYEYWNKAESDMDLESDMALAGIGACANIIAAFGGQLAPWHKKDELDRFEEAKMYHGKLSQ